jgi:hypothetical protein
VHIVVLPGPASDRTGVASERPDAVGRGLGAVAGRAAETRARRA